MVQLTIVQVRGMVIACLLLLCTQFKLCGQVDDISIEAGTEAKVAWLSSPYWLTTGINVGKTHLGLGIGRPSPSVNSFETALIMRRYLAGLSLRAPVTPYVSLRLSVRNTSYSPFFNTHSIAYVMGLFTGLKRMLPYGFHLIGEAGFSLEKVDVPAYHHFMEDRVWVKPSLHIGVGYTLRLRPWQGLKPTLDTMPVELFPSLRHSIGLYASRATYFLFRPTIEYRLAYSYTLKPRWDFYAGVEVGVSRWFFPTDPMQDSVNLLGARLGTRFFPIGRKRVSPFADGSLALARRLNPYFFQVHPNTKNFQVELGGGFRVQVLSFLHADLVIFHRIFWSFPYVGGIRQNESGIVFGLGVRPGR